MAKDKLKLALNKAKLLVSKTQSPNAYLILASLYQRLGKDEKMQQALKGAIQKSPDPERLKEIIKENFPPLEKTPDTLPRLQLKSKLLEKKEPSFRFKLREDTGLKLKMK
jgi:PHD/YefM family antitoxin component YafN of YafNO toxin-antitoxin module